MARRGKEQNVMLRMWLPDALAPEVAAWSQQGWPGVTQTTSTLLSHWFRRDETASEKFHPCQQRAIETVIYCHEILGRDERGVGEPRLLTPKKLFEQFCPEILAYGGTLTEELDSVTFPKYCLKMATGSGKTWVLAALIVWQYFNAIRSERPGQYSARFLVVVPGHEVLNRLLDSFKGKRDRHGNRDPKASDYEKELFIPSGAQWRGLFHLHRELLVRDDVRANMPAVDGAFIYLTNWQQFRLKNDKANLWDQMVGEDMAEQPRGEIIADFLSEFPDLVVMNDEAHHVHNKTTQGSDELVWRRFVRVMNERQIERHGNAQNFLLQVDFSATPFYGSGVKREYFPHIIYDYDLKLGLADMLVKQIFVEEREAAFGQTLEELDFRAVREEAEGKRRGEVSALSDGQKMMLQIGREKLEQIAQEFSKRGLDRKPVMLVLCEETEVANLVTKHFAAQTDERGRAYDEKLVMAIHSEMPDAELEKARLRLDTVDENDDPLRVVASVLMLREGFDKTNICIVVVLRATEADLLLEQIVGRGLRLMFPQYRYPELWNMKEEAREALVHRRQPSNSLDCLFIVEHPRFRAFYDSLRQAGYFIGDGKTQPRSIAGDLIQVELLPDRVPEFDIAWPVQIFEASTKPDLSQIDLSQLPACKLTFEYSLNLARTKIADTHLDTGTKAKTWRLEKEYYDFNHFLRTATNAIAKEGRTALLTAHKAAIAELVENFATNRLFGRQIDFSKTENVVALAFPMVTDHVVETLRRAIVKQIGETRYDHQKGNWQRLSEARLLVMRESKSVPTQRCIYPRQRFADTGGNLERDFIQHTLDTQSDVLAFGRAERPHKMEILYRDADGIARSYGVDFLVKTAEKMFLVETKADRDLELAQVALKTRAANTWCESASNTKPPDGISQPQQWEYLIIPESLYRQHEKATFSTLAEFAQPIREALISKAEGALVF
jgi:type III restriction enzyme